MRGATNANVRASSSTSARQSRAEVASDGAHAHAHADASERRGLSKKRQLVRHAHRHNKDGAAPDVGAGQTTTTSTLASHMMWRLAMRMSLRNENRLLQHVSRSILTIGMHKHSDRIHTEDTEGVDRISWPAQPRSKMLTNTASSEGSDDSSDTAPESDRPSLSSRESLGSAHALPPLPPLVFSPSKGVRTHHRGMSFQTYLNWPIAGIRPGLSVRIVRTEAITAVPSVTEYVVHVLDLHTKVFWISKNRFHDFYVLRQKIRASIKAASASEAEELKFLLDLPFPHRRFRRTSSDADIRRVSEVETLLRNIASLEPTSKARVNILRDFQLCLCSTEFVASLEKVDTCGEAPEPKWLSYDLFTRLNNVSTIEGHTCYKFLHAFRNRCAVVEAAVCLECSSYANEKLAADALKELRTVLTSVEKYIADHLSPRYADQFSLLDQSVDVASVIDDCIFRAVEDTIFVPLEKEVAFLVRKTVDADQEARLMANIAKLRGRSQAEFGIPEHLQSDDNWGKSCHHLSMIDERPLPCEKIQELLRSALEIFKSCGEKNLEWRENSALTADDYLPIHIYVVIHSGLKRPLLTKEYLGAMIHPSQMLGEVGYFLTMFEVALQYIADM